MGFLSAMKGANNSWGTAVGNFGVGYIGPKNMVDNRSHEMMISGTGMKGEVVFTKEDVLEIKLIAATSEWLKFKLSLKNGTRAVITFMALDVDPKKGKTPAMSLANFEWWLNGVIYN